MFRYTRTPTNPQDVVPLVSTMEAQVAEVDASTADAVPAMQATAQAYAATIVNVHAQVPPTMIAGANAAIGAVQATVNSVLRTTSRDVPAAISSMQVELAAKINTQGAIRISIYSNLATMPTLLTNKVSTITSSAMAAHGQIRADMSTSRAVLSTATSQQISTIVATEQAREIPYDNALTSAITAQTSTSSGALSAALLSEASRADASCTAKLATANVNPPSNTGTTDFATWYVSLVFID